MSFFFQEDGQAKTTAAEPAPLREADYVENKALLNEKRCRLCPLTKSWNTLKSPKMEPRGAKFPLIYILGEAPGEEEDKRDRQFIGKSGQFLRERIPERFENRIRYNNVIRCHPPKNRKPSYIEVECCRKFIEEDIEKSKPKVILAFGEFPIAWLLQRPIKVSLWRGRKSIVDYRHPFMHSVLFLPSRLSCSSRRRIGGAYNRS